MLESKSQEVYQEGCMLPTTSNYNRLHKYGDRAI